MISNRGNYTLVFFCSTFTHTLLLILNMMFLFFVLLALFSLSREAVSSPCIYRYEYYEMCSDLKKCRPLGDKKVCATTNTNIANNNSSASSYNKTNNRVSCVKADELVKNQHVELEHISSKKRI